MPAPNIARASTFVPYFVEIFQIPVVRRKADALLRNMFAALTDRMYKDTQKSVPTDSPESFLRRIWKNRFFLLYLHPQTGGLAQLARALAWHARGHEFESRILHQETTQKIANPCKSRIYRDFYFGRNAEKGIEKRVTCGLFGVLFFGPKKYTELLVTDWFAPVCSGLPLDMRHLGN